MKKFALALALVAAVAIPAVAGSPWTTYEYSDSYTTLWWFDGQYYSGTYSYEYSYQWKDNGNNYQSMGSSSWSFEADDGSFAQSGSSSWNDKFGYESADNYKSNGQVKTFVDGKLVSVENTTYHYTFNANGELVSFHWN